MKGIRWRSTNSKVIKACPRCGSLKMTLSSGMDIWLTPKRYICSECGYLGPIFLELETKSNLDSESD